MLQLSVSILTVSLISLCPGADLQKIIGGKPAEPGQFPYVVSLQLARPKGIHLCAGVILTNLWILSTAHCAAKLHPSNTVVFVGSATLNEHGKYYKVEQIYPHSHWDDKKKVHDISLIKLKQKIIWDNFVHPINLPVYDNSLDGYWAVVAGWGLTSYPGGASPNQLQYVKSKIRDCAYWGYPEGFENKKLCFGGDLENGTCKGDVGAPLIYNENNRSFVAGIVSSGWPCALGSPVIFTKVTSYSIWIRAFIYYG